MNIRVRDARDRMINTLGLGRTYPLRDLPLVNTQLIVAYEQAARIDIEFSQRGVRYELHHNGRRLTRTNGDPIVVLGTGGNAHLLSEPIVEDAVFQIFAVKQEPLQVYLHQTISVRVGLDESLQAEITTGELLDPRGLFRARLVDYDARVSVVLPKSQEGVDYQLVTQQAGEAETPLSAEVVTGNLHAPITLTTDPLREDICIRVRATRTFADNRTDTLLLKAELPLKVRANRHLPPIVVQPTPILPYKAAGSLVLTDTQTSASYTLFTRPISDAEYLHGTHVDEGQILVALEGEPNVYIRGIRFDDDLTDFTIADKNAYPGTGRALSLTLPPFEEDHLVLVKATKSHTLGDRSIPSTVWIEQAVAVLVRPNPVPNLTVTVQFAEGVTDGHLVVQNGQPGIFYEFSTEAGGKALGLPAYFHKPGKGFDQLAVSIDFVVTGAGSIDAPVIETPPLPTSTELHVTAKKAQSQITAPLNDTVLIEALPEIRLKDTDVSYGADTQILVIGSIEGEKYQPYLNGEPFKRALNGNGGDLLFKSDPVTGNITYIVQVTYTKARTNSVIRTVALTARVRTE